MRYLWVLVFVVAVGCGGDDDDTVFADSAPVPDAPAPIPDAAGPDAIPPPCPPIAPNGPVALPKNIIFILGDGMGVKHIEAGAIEAGAPLAFESLSTPVMLNNDSLSTDQFGEPTDSAASATAMATGVRVLNDVLSETPGGDPIQTILELAQAEGKAVGLISTATFFDASPGAFAAHDPDRENYDDIATEILTVTKPDLLLSGGHEVFEANDGALLTLAATEGYTVLRDATDLAAWDPVANPKVLGVFSTDATNAAPGIYPFYTTPLVLRDGSETDPLLTEMLPRALERLSADPDGFFLFVENETIDTSSHLAAFAADLDTSRAGIPPEVESLDQAYSIAAAWVAANSSFDDTLLIVASDHECGGYSFTGTDLANATFSAAPYHTTDLVPFYAAGPGAESAAQMCGGADIFLLMTGQLPPP